MAWLCLFFVLGLYRVHVATSMMEPVISMVDMWPEPTFQGYPHSCLAPRKVWIFKIFTNFKFLCTWSYSYPLAQIHLHPLPFPQFHVFKKINSEVPLLEHDILGPHSFKSKLTSPPALRNSQLPITNLLRVRVWEFFPLCAGMVTGSILCMSWPEGSVSLRFRMNSFS